ncbi:hypothetical protein cce_2111 [Crocosphaera subtropica ATCC 51142]|uniref:Uncharacterized protein n=1 Tax=Crocosphaera subtropica (strain ATCC 51142 / BH68) TaxID=43989 RepID=B1WNN2_CROS5|nr:hypothetical protein [Crocosphaera subtropica]ACB51461.1 hypothetical protein cce_2111 [Crocosphaera subtropica ATCC 51142]
MMSRKTWSSISVYDFFRTYNWTGETDTLAVLNPNHRTENSESLLSLNLQRFLLQSNWTGIQETISLSQSLNRSQESLLSLSVRDFFQEMVWKSYPTIAPISKPSSSRNSIDSSSTDLDLDNLSDLF